jgi:hypothetical protein
MELVSVGESGPARPERVILSAHVQVRAPPVRRAAPRVATLGATKLRQDLQAWVDARRRFHLSHMHVQMARELGLNPKKLGNIANHEQESWKLPLPQFIEEIYEKRFRRERPEKVVSVEDVQRRRDAKRAASKALKLERRSRESSERHPDPGDVAAARLPMLEGDQSEQFRLDGI